MSLGIKGKLITLTGTMLAIFFMATIFAVFKVIELRDQVEYLGKERLPLAETFADLRAASHATPRYTWVALEVPYGSEQEKAAIARLELEGNLLVASAEKYASFHLAPEGKLAIAEFIPLAKEMQALSLEAKRLIQTHTPASDALVKQLMINQMPPLGAKISHLQEGMEERQRTKNAAVVLEAEEKSKAAVVSLLVLCTVTTLLSAIFAFLFASNLSKQLLNITEQVGDSSSQVSSASGQLSSSSEELSNSAQGQAAAVEEASASLTEISGMIEANVKNAEDSNKMAGDVYRFSEDTKGLMNELSKAMEQILESNVKIEKLVKVIEEVGAKTEVIDDIVFKTQLLSFNASVEAERAGEHGRGFAVVAQEVGNLAQMSGKAANEISAIVKISIKEADEIARENKDRVENGGKLAVVANKKMTEVMEKISQIQAATNKVVDASKEQAQGINQISASVENINQTTQETASTSEESASASEELSGQAEALMGLVNNLRTIITGETHHETMTTNKNKLKSTAGGNVISIGSKNNKLKVATKVAAKKVVNSRMPLDDSEDAWEKI